MSCEVILYGADIDTAKYNPHYKFSENSINGFTGLQVSHVINSGTYGDPWFSGEAFFWLKPFYSVPNINKPMLNFNDMIDKFFYKIYYQDIFGYGQKVINYEYYQDIGLKSYSYYYGSAGPTEIQEGIDLIYYSGHILYENDSLSHRN